MVLGEEGEWAWYLVRRVRSVPSMRGAFTRHQRANMVLYSVSVIPPFPDQIFIRRRFVSFSTHVRK